MNRPLAHYLPLLALDRPPTYTDVIRRTLLLFPAGSTLQQARPAYR